MFLSALKDEIQQPVIRDFMAVSVLPIPPYTINNGIKSEHIVIVFNEESDCFWALGMELFQKKEFTEALCLKQPGIYWDLIRRTYRTEKTFLLRRPEGAKAFISGMDRFQAKHPYTASEIILWDSAELDHLLMKYDREVIEAGFAVLYLRYPQIEKLYKAGFEHIVHNWVLRDIYTDRDLKIFEKCFENARTVNRITSLTKGQWTQLLSFKLDLEEWYWIKGILNTYSVPDNQVPALVRMMIRGGENFRSSFRNITSCTADGVPVYPADQLIRDLLNDHGHTGMKPHEACIYLWDYIRLCHRNQVEPEYRTSSLCEEHDAMMVMSREKRHHASNEEVQELYDSRYEELKDYLFESEKLIVLLPMKWSDLLYEGRHNHNCVGSLYVTAYEEGRSNIFFIRKKENIHASYITVELNKQCEKTIQAFYSHNRKITEKEDLDFIKEWLKSNRRINRLRAAV